jgi:hypothetical protein
MLDPLSFFLNHLLICVNVTTPGKVLGRIYALELVKWYNRSNCLACFAYTGTEYARNERLFLKTVLARLESFTVTIIKHYKILYTKYKTDKNHSHQNLTLVYL